MNINHNSIKRIGVFRALQLGDLMCSIPAIRALRVACPQAEIILIGLPWAQSFVKRFSKYFDGFIHFPGYPGLPEQEFVEEDYKRFHEDIRSREFDLLIQMQGNGTIDNELLETWNAKSIAGFFPDYPPLNSNSANFIKYPDDVHEIHRHLLLMDHLGMSPMSDDLEFVLMPEDQHNFELLDVAKPYVCIHPGSRGRWRQWPPDLFALIGDECADAGYNVVITGTTSEADITNAVIKSMRSTAIDLTGLTTLGSMALLLRNSRLLVSNCTGVSHIAAATQTPSVVISMDGEPERWAPLNQHLHSTIDCYNTNRFEEVLMSVRRQLDPSVGKKQENVEPSLGLLSTTTKPL